MTDATSEAGTDLRSRARDLVETPRFRNFILGVIVFNAAVLGMETSKTLMGMIGPVLVGLDKICLGIFIVEILIKLYAYRLEFFRSAWNIFDVVVVGIALMPSSGGLSVLRALRILRVLRVISVVPSMRKVVQGFIAALPSMGSIVMLNCMVFYIGSVMATKLFGESHPQWFGTIGESAYSLFQIMTLESWSMGIVRPVMEVHPQAWAFFVPFILVTTFAVVNLVVGVVVNSMTDAAHEDADAATDAYRMDVMGKLEAIEERLMRMEEDRLARAGGQEPTRPDDRGQGDP